MSLEPTKFCCQCGYALDRITSPACPECGSPFEHQIDFTYQPQPPERTRREDLERRIKFALAFAFLYVVVRFVIMPWVGAALGCAGVVGYLIWISVLAGLSRPILRWSRIDSPVIRVILGGAVAAAVAAPDGHLVVCFAAAVGALTVMAIEMVAFARG